jgi:hypothetical protein
LDRILPEVIEIREVVYSGSDTDVSLHESSNRRKIKNRIPRKMMGLQFKEIKKAPEEIRSRKAALKMGGEDNMLVGLGLRLALLARNAAPDPFRSSPGSVQPINLRFCHVGAHPDAPRVGVQIDAGVKLSASSPIQARSSSISAVWWLLEPDDDRYSLEDIPV